MYAFSPLPYCNGPDISDGNFPLMLESQLSQCFTSTSTCSTVFSKIISIFVRRSTCSQGESLKSDPHTSHSSTFTVVTVSIVLVLLATASDSVLPLPLAPLRVKEDSSFSVCEDGLLEFLLVFFVVFSRKMAINKLTSINML